MTQPLILVVDDEPKIRRLLSINLASLGYEVICAVDGPSALAIFEDHQPDLVLLDVMMPGLDGFEVLRRIRTKSNCAVILLTAKDQVEDKIKAFDLGADDYLVKPFAFEELLARIRVMLRKKAEVKDSCCQVADLKVFLDSHRVFRGDTEIMLSNKEFSVLRYLIMNKGIVLSREKIEQHIWNYDYTGGSNVIDVYIRYLRKKIDSGYEPKLIHTVRGAGYVLKEME